MTPARSTTPELPIAAPIKAKPKSSQAFLPTPPTKRKNTYRDTPVALKLQKITSTSRAVTRPETLSWLADLEEEDYEPPQSPTPAGPGAVEEDETSEDEEEKVSKLGPKPILTMSSRPPAWSISCNLQRAGTLRKSMVNRQVQNIVRAGLTHRPDFSKLALPVCDKTWTVKSLEDFKAELRQQINDASDWVTLNHGKYIEVDKAHCRMDIPPYPLNLYYATIEKASRPVPDCCHQKALTILMGDKGKDYMECEECSYSQALPRSPLQRPKKYAVKVAGIRIPVKVRPERLCLNSKLGHVDVGGIHVVVDHCAEGQRMIKFRATQFSKAHEMHALDFHLEYEINILDFALPEESREVEAGFNKLYWQEGAFNAITHCWDFLQHKMAPAPGQLPPSPAQLMMRLFGGKNNKIKVDPPKIRIEKVVVDRPAQKPKPKSTSALSGSASRSSSSHRPSPKPLARQASHSPYPSSSDEKRLERKRKAPSVTRRSPASDRIEFDKDSDGEDDGWMTLDTKRQRKGTEDGSFVDPNRKLRSVRAFEDRMDSRSFIHAVDVASLEHKCVPVMGAQKEDVAIRLQYPSLQPREKYELVWGKDKIDAVEASIKVVRHVAETYLTEEEAEPFTNPNGGIIRRLEKASNRNIQDLMGFKAALREYNEKLRALVEDGVIAKNLDKMHELPQHLVAFILDQIYDRTVALKVELLSKYENGTDYVYGELLHPFISKILVEQTRMTSGQVFVDLGSGVGNVVLQAALEIGCESWGCEMMENACNLAEEQKKEFDARCMLWGVRPGKVHLERGDFRKNLPIHEALKRADVVLVNNKAFTSQLNDDLVRMFLDLKSGCKIVSLKSFVAEKSNNHNINDVGSTILEVEECTYPEGYVSWTNAGGSYFISTRK
ncbi:histone-lysine N-methyltransferase H3 lysine-79 specific [Fusarium acutatum]|uniref:Histone-lysine N-methyltransferase, H3 lysine-79 specific n=1 Tax=Fusarium acutatum TaxID=78861 RepID=A0A8H4JU51_9HYPO|nr:histone-lysine N-methyltransferase H3 lysine-79 specific [Fusarium acutatum]